MAPWGRGVKIQDQKVPCLVFLYIDFGGAIAFLCVENQAQSFFIFITSSTQVPFLSPKQQRNGTSHPSTAVPASTLHSDRPSPRPRGTRTPTPWPCHPCPNPWGPGPRPFARLPSCGPGALLRGWMAGIRPPSVGRICGKQPGGGGRSRSGTSESVSTGIKSWVISVVEFLGLLEEILASPLIPWGSPIGGRWQSDPIFSRDTPLPPGGGGPAQWQLGSHSPGLLSLRSTPPLNPPPSDKEDLSRN